MMQKFLEGFFMIMIFIAFMKGVDVALQKFVHKIAVQNIMAVVAALVSLILSAGLSEWIVKKIKDYL